MGCSNGIIIWLFERISKSFKQRVTSMEINIKDIIYIPLKLVRVGSIVHLKIDKTVEEGALLDKL